MKPFYSIILILFIVSCDSNDTVTISKKEYQQLKGDTEDTYPREIHWIDQTNKQTGYIVKVENHEYLTGNPSQHPYSFYFIHYPDCKFCKKDTLK